MHLKISSYPSLWLAIVALLLGIWSGRLLRATTAEQQNQQERFNQRTRSVDRASGSIIDPNRDNRKTTSYNSKKFFIVPPEAFRKIRVSLLEGTSLNHKECKVLGLNETQIRDLEQLVQETVTRWRERENATMKTIPLKGAGTLIHIPAADRETAEREFKNLHEKALQIGGEQLGPLVHHRLTDGHSPSRFSNWGTGMLNVLTAGYGTMDRFVWINPMPGGLTSYQVIDVLPDRIEKGEIDGEMFERLVDSENYMERKHIHTKENLEQLSHLLQLP